MQSKHQLALTILEGVKLLEALGLPRELGNRVERFEIIGDPRDVIRVNITYSLLDNDIPAIGEAFVGYHLVRSED